ncbi:MAG: hypothetical protein ACYC9W_10270, partial [Candidatus Limnocylindria bacterium]
MKTPTAGDLLEFLRADGGWKPVRSTKHGHHEKTLEDGTVLSTHVSFGSRATVGPETFKLILATQLAVTEAQFWETIRLKKSQRTTAVVAEPRKDPLTLALRRELMRRLHYTDDQLVGMTGSQAKERLR